MRCVPVKKGRGRASAANGYLTAYTRSPLGQITGVAQDSQPGNGGVENRSFSFDQLGRLTLETNPENGTVNYAFDTNSTCGVTSAGDLILRTDAAGNLTCYAHDALHRVTHIWYSGTTTARPTWASAIPTPPRAR